MNYDNSFPEWKNKGVEPSDRLKETGFVGGYKPPANVFNWFWSKVISGIKELQTKLSDACENIEQRIDTLDETVLRGYFEEENLVSYSGISSDSGIEISYIEGKSGQVITKGNQLFDASRFTTTTKGGATVTNLGDGSFRISGNGSLTDNFAIGYTWDIDKSLLKEGNIRLYCGAMTYPHCSVSVISSGGSIQLTNVYGGSETKQLTADILNGDNLQLAIAFSGSTGNEILAGIIKPMLYQNSDGTWEKFSGGLPSPSAEYPQEIKSIEEVNVISHSYQLFDADNISSKQSGGATLTNNGNGSFTIKGNGELSEAFNTTYSFKPNKRYLKEGNIRLLCDVMSIPYCNVIVASSGGSVQLTNRFGVSETKQLTSEIINCDDLTITVGFTAPIGETITPCTVTPMLYQSGEGDYEDFNYVETPIDLATSLRSLPNGICDEYIDGKIVRQVGSHIINNIASVTTLGSGVVAVIVPLDDKSGACEIDCARCDRAIIKAAGSDETNYMYINPANFVIVGDVGDTLETMRTKYIGTEILYELAVPVIEEVEASSFLVPSFYPHTRVVQTQDIEGTMIWKIKTTGGSGGSNCTVTSDIPLHLRVTEAGVLQIVYDDGSEE